MSIGATQANRPLKLLTPSLGTDVLLITGFTGHEAISELFNFQVAALAENTKPVAFDKLIGQEVAIELTLPKGKKRYFHGIVKKVTEGTRDDRFTKYQLEIVPHVWLLTKRYQSRIFQHITVMDILKKVFAGFEVASQVNMAGLQPRRFTAQYRETDFAFASRLMEEEGIFYYFKHTDMGDQMILANTPQAHPDVPEQAKITFGTTGVAALNEYRIDDWEKSQELRSGKYSLWDHHFEMPQKTLEAEKPTIETVAVGKVTHKVKIANNDKLEIYDYPGGYSGRFDGIDKGGSAQPAELKKLFEENNRVAGIRMQEEAVQSIQIRGGSNCGNFVSGYKFTLDRHFNGDAPYVLVSVDHQATVSGGYVSGNSGGGFEYRNQFGCIPLTLPFRPARVTPKPIIPGTQTAMVVGPKGEKIFCDKYGRVKVQMNWDRQGNEDLDSSCWMRVSQSRGGGKYGGMSIPHVGQEVIVSFEEGDVDRPVVTGCVFNADNMPPLALPENKTQTVTRDHGGNQMIMEGKGGEQQILLHSPHSNTTLSIGSASPSVHRFTGSGGGAGGPDDNAQIATDVLGVVDGHMAQSADATDAKGPAGHFEGGFKLFTTHSWYVHAAVYELVHIDGNAYRWITGASHITLDGAHTLNINNTSDTVVVGNATETYHGNLELTVDKGTFTETVKGDYKTTVSTGNYTLKVDTGMFTETVKGDYTTIITTGNYKLETSSGNIFVHAVGNYKRWSDHDDEFTKGWKKTKHLGGINEFIVGNKNSMLLALKTESIAIGEVKKILGYKSEFTAGIRKEATVGQKYTTQSKQKTTAGEWKWSGLSAKFGSVMKILG